MELKYKYKVCTRCYTYNQSAYIKETLDGFALQQTSFPVVFCVVDDASLDGEAEVIRKWCDANLLMGDHTAYRKQLSYGELIFAPCKQSNHSFFAILLLTENHNNNKELKRSYLKNWEENAEYRAICEGDDFWVAENKLQKQVSFLDSNPDYVLSYTDAYIVNSCSHVMQSYSVKRESGHCLRSLIERGNYIVTAGVCYRQCFDQEWLTERERIPFKLMVGDKPHWIFLSTKGLFKFFPEKMVAYRMLSESASHTKNYEKSMAYSDNVRDINLYFNELYDVGISRLKILKDARLHRLRSTISFGKRAFFRELVQTISSYPSLLLKLNLWRLIVLLIIKEIHNV